MHSRHRAIVSRWRQAIALEPPFRYRS